jgi:hypothetical protein
MIDISGEDAMRASLANLDPITRAMLAAALSDSREDAGHLTGRPRVEVAGYRDPDGGVTLTLFLNGEPVEPDALAIVDLGKVPPYTLEERVAVDGATPAWVAAVREHYQSGADAGYAIPANFSAVDPQDLAVDHLLDPDVWIGEGVQGATQGPGLVRDNTARAGQALRAVLATADLDPECPAEECARHALAAYLDVEADSWSPEDNIQLAAQIGDLLSDVVHLSDARGLDIGGEPPTEPNRTLLFFAVRRLNLALYEVCNNQWRPLLAEPWDEIVGSALRRYQEERDGRL